MTKTGTQNEGSHARVPAAARTSGRSDETEGIRRTEIALVSVALAAAAVFIANLVDFGYGRDQGIYAVVADAVQRGEAPYRAAWDFKPPGIYFVFALAEILFGDDQRAIRVLEGLCLLSLFPAFALFSRRQVGSARAGLLGAAFAVFAYVPLEFWNTAQPESFGAVALAWALVFATHQVPEERRHAARLQCASFAAAGALYAVAALLKPPLGGGILVSAVAIFATHRASSKNSESGKGTAIAVPIAALALGGTVPVLATLGYFAVQGALGDLYEALFVFTPRYVSQDFQLAKLPSYLFIASFQWLFRMTPLSLLGLVPLLLLRPTGPHERQAIAHVVGVVAMSLIGVALQAKFFNYHYAAAFTLTGLLAGWGIWKIWLLVRHSAVQTVIAVFLMAAVYATALPGKEILSLFWERSERRLATVLHPEQRTTTRDRLYGQGDVNSRDNRLAGEWLAEHTPPESFLYIWGFQPVIYDLAGRRPASRYIYNVPQIAEWTRDATRGPLMRELEATPPAAIIVIHRDRAVFETLTNNAVDGSEALRHFPELTILIRKEYRLGVRIGDLEIFVRQVPPA